ncbi:putative DNA-binding protein [Alkalicella caledoniensis]|uniref:UPF0122 protein HYG86_17180 n=1 Tax=Alkalicella caledoniensis TaxID=2731377 RepID=A0A7G9WCG8_ALKCA|nr:putative DNA-binding protein [Alkalicella caledoniensis]QNO16380.1 putative DNA-binding protein [Alkalicella caledoniensis]
MLDKVTHLNDLYDIYGQLLTQKQQHIFQMYYQDDLSLGEIAEQVNTSRQAVYDNLKRVANILESYETKLNLYKKDKDLSKILDRLEESIGSKNIEKSKELITLLKQNLG